VSAVGGAVGVALALVLEEVLLANKSAPSAVTGIFGTISKVVASVADPNVPGIPDLKQPASRKKG